MKEDFEDTISASTSKVLKIPRITGLKTSSVVHIMSANIKWAHAVNDRSFLETSLNSDVDMLEADIQMGTVVNGSGTEEAIMAHPPNTTSDICLLEFVSMVDYYNKISQKKKGMKLDFKSISAFEFALSKELFCKIISEADYPVWLNADILVGPLASHSDEPVSAHRFLKGAKLFPKSTLSLGWITGYDATTKTGYTHSQIEEMLRTIETNGINQPITFAVRAGLVAESKEELKVLLKNGEHTLTIWSGRNDSIDIGKLNDVLDSIGCVRIFVDVPTELRKQLRC